MNIETQLETVVTSYSITVSVCDGKIKEPIVLSSGFVIIKKNDFCTFTVQAPVGQVSKIVENITECLESLDKNP